MIQVTLQFTSIAAAVAALGKIDASAVVTTSAASGNGTPPAPSPAPTAAPAATPAPAASTVSSPKPAESPAPAASADTAQGELSYEKDVKPIVIKVGAAGKRDNLVELLKKFGVAKGPEVAADKLPAFKAELEALLA